MMTEKQQVFAVLVNNHPGVLLRLSGLFLRRGFNIESIVACGTENPAFTRITLVVTGDEGIFTQVIRQLMKLEDVLTVEMLDAADCSACEMLLVKVNADTAARRAEVLRAAQSFGGRVLDIGERTLSFELTGGSALLDECIAGLEPFGICEMARSGIAALQRGDRTIHDNKI